MNNILVIVGMLMAGQAAMAQETTKTDRPTPDKPKAPTEVQLMQSEIARLRVELEQHKERLAACTVQAMIPELQKLERELLLSTVGTVDGWSWDWARHQPTRSPQNQATKP